MPIPEWQLDNWSHQGAITGSAAAYNSIQTALTSSNSNISRLDYELFLQGSYRNSTNIHGDSDVDIVAKLKSTFTCDLSALDDSQRVGQSAVYPAAGYQWSDFRRGLLQTLEEYYGKVNVKPLSKCIQVITGPGRITADVVPAIGFRRYNYFYSQLHESYVQGITLFDSASSLINNFPEQHIANGSAKNAAGRTNGWYKPTVRVFKNARNRLVDDGRISNELVPSYCLECLIYNAPDSCFGGCYGDTYCSVVNCLWELPFSQMISQNGLIPLFGASPAQWNSDAATEFLNGLRELWNSWS